MLPLTEIAPPRVFEPATSWKRVAADRDPADRWGGPATLLRCPHPMLQYLRKVPAWP